MYRRVEERVHYIVCSEDLVIISLEHSGDVLAFSAHSAELLYSVEIFGGHGEHVINISYIIEVKGCKKHHYDYGIQLDVGPNHVLAASGE